MGPGYQMKKKLVVPLYSSNNGPQITSLQYMTKTEIKDLQAAALSKAQYLMSALVLMSGTL